MPFYDQQRFDVSCEWGLQGLDNLAPSDVIVIVDVLSFTTCVEIAVSRGATVFPFPSEAGSPSEYAAERDAVLAQKRSAEPGALSLSPSSLTGVQTGTRLVLPSPNGSTLSFTAAGSGASVIAGCLRNAAAVSSMATHYGGKISVIPAGERWNDGSLRPAFEDMVGAGAIIRGLLGTRSPEAQAAVTLFESVKSDLSSALRDCSSGSELIERGFEQDVGLAAELDVSDCAPVLRADAFVAAEKTA